MKAPKKIEIQIKSNAKSVKSDLLQLEKIVDRLKTKGIVFVKK